MERCSGPTLEQMQAAQEGPLEEKTVANYMRSVVRTIQQCHDKGEAHGAVSPSKFMLLSEDRDAPLKATGFGRLTQSTESFLNSIAQLAPETFREPGKGLRKHADMWAAGLLSTRLLTEYFPFDDIIGALTTPAAPASE